MVSHTADHTRSPRAVKTAARQAEQLGHHLALEGTLAVAGDGEEFGGFFEVDAFLISHLPDGFYRELNRLLHLWGPLADQDGVAVVNEIALFEQIIRATVGDRVGAIRSGVGLCGEVGA